MQPATETNTELAAKLRSVKIDTLHAIAARKELLAALRRGDAVFLDDVRRILSGVVQSLKQSTWALNGTFPRLLLCQSESRCVEIVGEEVSKALENFPLFDATIYQSKDASSAGEAVEETAKPKRKRKAKKK